MIGRSNITISHSFRELSANQQILCKTEALGLRNMPKIFYYYYHYMIVNT